MYALKGILVQEFWNMAVKTLIINHVLNYAFDKHQSGHFTDLKTRLIEFYDDTSITEAKAVIWEHTARNLLLHQLGRPTTFASTAVALARSGRKC